MKKIFTVVLAGLFSFLFLSLKPIKSNAQDYYGSSYSYKPVSMGITFSPNVSWLRYGDSDDYRGTAGLGFAYGLLTDFSMSENYYFSTGLLINSLRTESTFDGIIGGDARVLRKSQHRLQYVEIPVAVKLKSTQRYHRSYYGKFGFTPGVKISARERVNDAQKRQTIDGANTFRLALQIGGGVEWQLDHNLHLMTGLTFNNGFTRTMKAGEPKNSYFSLDFGVFF